MRPWLLIALEMMRRISRIAWTRAVTAGALGVLLILSPAPARAAFDDRGVGARAPGMADAFVGVADDATALFYNPAGLSQIPDPEVATQFGNLLQGLDDGTELGTSYLGYAHPFPNGGVLGIGLHQFRATGLYRERVTSVGYGWHLNRPLFDWPGSWSFGAALKQLHREFSPNEYTGNALGEGGLATDRADPLFDRHGFTSDSYAIDLGALYRFGLRNRYQAGLLLMNVNQPDISLGGNNDKPPVGSKVGFGFRPDWGVLSAEVRRVKRLSSQTDNDIALGAERRFAFGEWGAIELRGGYAEGSRGYRAITLGGSYLIGRIQMDYSMSLPIGNLDEMGGSHRIGFTYRFAAPHVVPAPSPAVAADAEPAARPDETVSVSTAPALPDLEPVLKRFGAALGQYFIKRDAKAPMAELRAMLDAMREEFAEEPIDVSILTREREALEKRVSPAPATPPKPAVKPVPLVQPERTLKPAVKPAPTPEAPARAPAVRSAPEPLDPELAASWTFYQRAVERGVSDHERLELLEAIIHAFGEEGRKQVQEELGRVRRRLR